MKINLNFNINWKKAIDGVLLSFVFVLSFVLIEQQAWVLGKTGVFLAGVSDVFYDNIENQLQEENAQNAENGPNIYAQAAISVFVDGVHENKILFNKNKERILSIASISKLMTALVVFDNFDLAQQIKITDSAIQQSSADEPLKVGEIFYVKDLLYAMLIDSDNAAGNSLAESVGREEFARLMNEKAKQIGMKDTSFSNPTGLGLENFSNARDLAKLAEYLLKERRSILGISTMQYFDLYTADGKILHKFSNTNQLLNDSSLGNKIVGGKTGETRTAGQCLLLVLKASDDNGYFINVILNSKDRFGEMRKIIDWVNAYYYNR